MTREPGATAWLSAGVCVAATANLAASLTWPGHPVVFWIALGLLGASAVMMVAAARQLYRAQRQHRANLNELHDLTKQLRAAVEAQTQPRGYPPKDYDRRLFSGEWVDDHRAKPPGPL